jgi:cardiolipin synthase (CMP-forming)
VAAEEDPTRILTIPNAITLVRLACLPLYLYLLFGRDERVQAAILLAALGATDWVDGYVARHFHQVSDLGKILDPIADRLLFFVGVGGIIVLGDAAPAWFCWLVIAREIFVSVAVITLALLGAARIDVTWFGKAGTFCLMFAFPMFLVGSSDLSIAPAFNTAAWLIGVPGLILAYYAAVLYVPIGLRALRDGRAARSGSPERPVAPSG